MITTPTTATAERLLSADGGPRISLYMPTHRAGADIWQDPIRCKNLIRQAHEQLQALETEGASRSQADELMNRLDELQQDRLFWQHQGDGLAVFCAADTWEVFRLPNTLPEISIVGPRFHLKPLLMAMAEEQPFHVLALSQNAVKLFMGSASGLHEVDLALDIDVISPPEMRKSLRGQATTAGARVTHALERDQKGQLADYCRKVDRVIAPHVKAHEPVVLAAVDYLGAIYREVSTLPNLAHDTIGGNPETTHVDQLHAAALPIARRLFDGARTEFENRYFDRQREGKALDEPAAAVQAARQGRVETVFVPIGVHVWGHINSSGDVVLSDRQGPQDEDLLNRVLIDTWKTGGRVFAVAPNTIPGGRMLAATTRF
ncbi:MAG: hypothetical protein ABL995_17205 [Bryobacteraceae bacterium]